MFDRIMNPVGKAEFPKL